MPSTGVAAFSVTRDGMINAALRTLRVLQENQFANGQQINSGAEALNMLIKFWQSTGMQLWTYAQILVPMQASKLSYTIGPVSADVISVRPLRVFDGTFIRYTTAGFNQDTPLTALNRTDYLNLTGKNGGPGIPNSFYYDAQINTASATSPSTGYGTLYLYVPPSDTTRTVYLNVQRPLYDMNSSDDEFDFPAEWFLALRYNLAVLLADEEEVPEDRLKRVIAQAERYKESLSDWSVEEQPVRFKADTTAYQRFGRGR